MKDQVAALAERGAISVSQLLHRADGELGIPTTQFMAKVYNATPEAAAISQIPDIIGMLAYINREALTDLLDRQITAKSDDRTALTLDQRQKQTSQTMDALFTVELDEATLTFQAWQDGLPVEANVKINPNWRCATWWRRPPKQEPVRSTPTTWLARVAGERARANTPCA
jgi:hypothetical protein